jgi:hypothetical protein
MTVKTRFALILGILLTAIHAEASVTITPASPTSQDPIRAVIDVSPGCADIVTTSITGSSILTDIVQQGCAIGPPVSPVQETVIFGPLAPGTYTYDVFLDYEHTGRILLSRQTIVVAPPVPSLSELGLAILGISLAAIACLALSKSCS